ncbi:MAG: superoxide dismutase [Bacteroidales bacterium]|nr:superoxide dismutase [Bacteroidales bacterium]MBR0300468.1 superoxide dismutase [Bacteroidales bacterium]
MKTVELMALPYAPDALEPVISGATLGFHHGKHLRAYVDNLNKLLEGGPLEGLPLERIVCAAPAGPLFNNAGQVLNHNLYFGQFCTGGSPLAEGALKRRIEAQWGSLDAFKEAFEAAGAGLFGSGWVWLQADAAGELSIAQYAGADNPVAHGFTPVLTFDVWEHAYYLDFQNRRAAYLKALWDIVDWSVVEGRL